MINGLIGKKLGMTEVLDPNGRLLAVTLIELGPCTVTQLKTRANDGYEAVQVGFGRKKLSRVRKAERGHFAKSNVAAPLATREFTRAGSAELVLGQSIGATDVFQVGDRIDVSGVSKGHGYAGVIKRHHFSGFPGSHGTHEYFRHGGSIGNRSFPGRVFKGLRMAGQMGNHAVTTCNLMILEILADKNAIVVVGSVPGADGGLVVARHAAKHRRSEEERAHG